MKPGIGPSSRPIQRLRKPCRGPEAHHRPPLTAKTTHEQLSSPRAPRKARLDSSRLGGRGRPGGPPGPARLAVRRGLQRAPACSVRAARRSGGRGPRRLRPLPPSPCPARGLPTAPRSRGEPRPTAGPPEPRTHPQPRPRSIRSPRRSACSRRGWATIRSSRGSRNALRGPRPAPRRRTIQDAARITMRWEGGSSLLGVLRRSAPSEGARAPREPALGPAGGKGGLLRSVRRGPGEGRRGPKAVRGPRLAS